MLKMASNNKKTNINIETIDLINNSDSHFKTLGLRFPELNYNQAPTWNVLNEEIENRFKKRSVLVHPDKNLELRIAHDELLDHKMRADSVKEYIERNTDEKLGFVPEHLKGASKKQIMLYQRKSRKREKKLNREHFELYKGRIKKECRSRLQTQIAKKAEEDYRERELVKKEGDYFKRLGALNEKNKDRPKDEESAVIEKMIKRRMKSRIC